MVRGDGIIYLAHERGQKDGSDQHDQAGSQSRVQVVVRVRPVLPEENAGDVAVVCTPDGSKVQVHLPPRRDSLVRPSTSSTAKDARQYAFDACLNGSTTQAQLFDICGMEELVDAALDGYTVTIFAFGQTGSGKTHTICGPRLGCLHEGQAYELGEPHPDDGLLTRCLAHAYRGMASREQSANYMMEASCCELYNETITDLLSNDKTRQLQVRQDASDGFLVQDLSWLECPSLASATAVMAHALSWRHTRAHRLNNYSSRSHCMMTFKFRSQDAKMQGAKGAARRIGKLVLVDLAGSERLKDTGNSEKEALRETGHINRSLFTLGQVLSALSHRSGGHGGLSHVPYRDSKLTTLLWDGLRGRGRALMLACMAPLRQHSDETLTTLHFASMALRVKSEPVVMLEPQDQLVMDLKETIKALRQDMRSLAGALQQMSNGAPANNVLQTLPQGLLQDALRLGGGGSKSAPASNQKLPDRGAANSASGARPPPPLGLPLSKPSSADMPLIRLASGRNRPSPGQVSYRARSPDRTSSAGKPGWNASSTMDYTRGMSPATQPRDSTWSAPSRDGSWTAATSGRDSPTRRSRSPGVSGRMSPGPSAGRMSPGPSAGRMSPAGISGRMSPAGGRMSPAGGRMSPASPGSPTRRSLDPKMFKLFMSLGAVPGGLQQPVHNPLSQPPSDLPGWGRSSGTIHAAGSFPELAALESQFQAHMRAGSGASSSSSRRTPSPVHLGGRGSPGAGMFAARSSAHSPTSILTASCGRVESLRRSRALPPMRSSSDGGSEDVPAARAAAEAAQALTAAQKAAMSAQQAPEDKAMAWAERNMWFGSDQEMTSYAYQIHDALVLQHGIDPSSDEYYAAIEQSVSSRFPDRWQAAHASSSHVSSAGASSTGRGGSGSAASSRQALANRRSMLAAEAAGRRPVSQAESLGSTTSNMSLSELQLQYNAQRMAVVDELRRAKEEAEQERERILRSVGQAIRTSNSGWA